MSQDTSGWGPTLTGSGSTDTSMMSESLPIRSSSPQTSAWGATIARSHSEEDEAYQNQEPVSPSEQAATPLASASLAEDAPVNIISLMQCAWETDNARKYFGSGPGSTRDRFAQAPTENSNSRMEEVLLGAGLTFSVTKRYLPDKSTRRLYSAGAEYVAVKHVNIDKRKLRHEPDYSARILKDVAIEMRCLTIPYLRSHENIVTLFSIGWDRDPNSGFIWPSLYLEYADFGSLYTLQARSLCLHFNTKTNLLLDIANGIEALHACEIVHGDIKRENTLIFRHPERGFIAKLSDFGCSLADFPDPTSPIKRRLPFSMYYAAPEFKTLGTIGDAGILPTLLPATDLYSFGLTAWWTFMDGIWPQKCLPGLPLHDDYAFIKALEDQDTMSEMAKEVVLTQRRGVYSLVQINAIVAVFESTIRTDPKSRDLKKAIDSLEESLPAAAKRRGKDSLDLGLRPNPEVPRALPLPRSAVLFVTSLDYDALDHSVKRQIFRTMIDMVDKDEDLAKYYAFPIAFCLLKGLGTNIDSDEGLRWMSRAALANNVTAANLLLATFRSLDIEPLNYQQVLNWTYHCIVKCGSYSALRQWAKEKGGSRIEYAHLIQAFHLQYWNNVYQIDKLLKTQGWDLDNWESLLQKLNETAKKVSEQEQGAGLRFSDFTIDVPRKHHLLHFLAMRGSEECLYIGITSLWSHKNDPYFGLDIDCQNDLGETPLLQATRACRLAAVDVLLKYGARADRLTVIKQSPLHCLSFMIETKETFQRLVAQMVQRGGDLNQFAENDESHVGYATDGTVPFGTPLHFAVFKNNEELVEALLEARADPTLESGVDSTLGSITKKGRVKSAMHLAASLRQHVIVEMFLKAAPSYEMKDSQRYPFHSRLIPVALVSAEWKTEWMIIHGQEEPRALLQYFQMLERRGTDFRSAGGEGENALQLSIEFNASCDVIDYLLKFKPTLEIEFGKYLWRPISLGNKQLFDLLLEKIDNVNEFDSTGYTLLQTCVIQAGDDTYFAEKLLERGADPSICDENKDPALLSALGLGMHNHAKLLLPLTSGTPTGSKITLLGFLVCSTSRYILPSVSLVLKMKPLETNPFLYECMTSLPGYTVFHRIAEHETGAQNTQSGIDLINMLLQVFGTKDIINSQEQKTGLTALHLAVVRQHKNLVAELCNPNILTEDAGKRLCKEGADPDIRSFEEDLPPLLRQIAPRELAARLVNAEEVYPSFRVDIQESGPEAMERNRRTRVEIYNMLAFQHEKLTRLRGVKGP